MREGGVFKCGIGVGTIVVNDERYGPTFPAKRGKIVEMLVWKCGKTCFEVSVVIEYLDQEGRVCRTSMTGIDVFDNFAPEYRVPADDFVHG